MCCRFHLVALPERPNKTSALVSGNAEVDCVIVLLPGWECEGYADACGTVAHVVGSAPLDGGSW